MSATGLFVRFTIIYVAALVALSIAIQMLGLDARSGINNSALMGAVVGSCLWFASRNKRYLNSHEKRFAFWGMLAIDMLLQLTIILAIAASGSKPVTANALLFSLGVVGLLHGLTIYIFIMLAGKLHAKQAAKSAQQGIKPDEPASGGSAG